MKKKMILVIFSYFSTAGNNGKKSIYNEKRKKKKILYIYIYIYGADLNGLLPNCILRE